MGIESFFASLAPAIKQISPLVSLISDMRGKNQAYGAARAGNVPSQAETQQNALYQALLDQNSPIMKQLVDQDRATNLADLQTGIRERQLADRREVSMGRRPTFFNPERADEAVSFLTSRGLAGANTLANQTAIQRLLSAASGFGNLQPAQVGRLKQGTETNISQASYGSTVPNRILEILQQLGQSSTPAAPAPPKQQQLSGYKQYGQYGRPSASPYELISNQMRY